MKRNLSTTVRPDYAFFIGLRNGILYSIPLWAIILFTIYHEEILAWLKP